MRETPLTAGASEQDTLLRGNGGTWLATTTKPGTFPFRTWHGTQRRRFSKSLFQNGSILL